MDSKPLSQLVRFNYSSIALLVMIKKIRFVLCVRNRARDEIDRIHSHGQPEPLSLDVNACITVQPTVLYHNILISA